MWFVNIDHWTLKLAYLALQKIKEDLTKKNNQVDIYISKGERRSIALSSVVRSAGFTPFKSILKRFFIVCPSNSKMLFFFFIY